MKRWQIASLALGMTCLMLAACSGAPAAEPENPERLDHTSHIVTMDFVIDALQKPDEWVLIDTRTAEEFNGESRLPNAFGTGRIKGAVNVDKNLAFNSDGERLAKEELVKLYDFIGNKKVVVYCHGGARSKDILEILLDLDFDAWHYDGSWIDWSKAASIADGGPDEVVLNLTEDWTDNEAVIEVP